MLADLSMSRVWAETEKYRYKDRGMDNHIHDAVLVRLQE
jgi:hypothetical protein